MGGDEIRAEKEQHGGGAAKDERVTDAVLDCLNRADTVVTSQLLGNEPCNGKTDPGGREGHGEHIYA